MNQYQNNRKKKRYYSVCSSLFKEGFKENKYTINCRRSSVPSTITFDKKII